MAFDVVELPARWVVGHVTRTSNAAEADPGRARLGRLRGRAAAGSTVAVLTDDEDGADGEYTEVVGREVASPEELTEGQVAVRVPGGRFARFACSGRGPQAVVAGWQEVWAADERAEIVRSYLSDVELWPADEPPTILVGVRPGPG